MKNLSIALVFFAATILLGRASESDPNAQGEQGTVVLSDGIDLDKILLDLNSSDPATSSTAQTSLVAIRNKNPTGKRRLSYGALSLELPSWQWDYNRKLGVQGIAVDRQSANAGGDMASVLVDRLPGISNDIVGNVFGDLPEGAKMSKTELTAFSIFSGIGTREIAIISDPKPRRLECVLFFPKNKLQGYYIFTVFSGPPAGDQIERELRNIAKSIQGH